MMRLAVCVVFAWACLAPYSSVGQEREPTAPDPFEGVTAIARELIEAEAPHWREALSWPLVIDDGGSYWILRFSPPEIAEGGPPMFYIEKGTMRLVRVVRRQ